MRAPRVMAATAAVLAFGLGSAGAATARAEDRPAPAADVLDRPRRGQDALTRLGARLDEVAAAHGERAETLRERLRDDDTLWVDKGGRLFYVEPQHAGATGAAPLAQGAPFALGETFTLHSRPGANRVIFLDVDGHTVSGTAWNTTTTGASFYAEPYDSDGSPTTFSDAEREQIQLLWQRVAEDYAPFDIDVTTQDPGFDAINRSSSSDQVYGTRVLISGADEYSKICTGGCGGVAYVGTYDSTTNHAYYQPAWVFTQGVGTGAKNIAEAAAHEAGHNLGLSHDGTATQGYYAGHGAWAPIMGVGYYEPISQWSRGEYTGANNTEDDFAVVQANGGPLRADDAGDTTAAARSLGSGPALAFDGRITTRTDLDVFSFTAATGPATFTVTPAPTGPNLDVRLEVLSSTGAVLATSDPPSAQLSAGAASGLDASIITTLTAGTYYLRVDGVGYGIPANTGYSDYGSVGVYSLSGTLSAGGPPPSNLRPVAVASASPASGTAPLTVTFSSAGSSDDVGIVTYAWSFSNGGTASGQTASRTYTSSGTYTATLTVSDAQGLTGTATVTVVVAAAPAPPPPTAPASVTTTGSRTVSISWSAVSGATSYDVLRQTRQAGGGYDAGIVVRSGVTGTFTTNRPGPGTYVYSVRARSAAGTSAYTAAAPITLTR